MGGKVI